MFEPKFLSIICTRGIMVSSLGFEPNVLGSNTNFFLYFCQLLFLKTQILQLCEV